MIRKCLFAFAFILVAFTSFATTRRVLFIGNSYIYTNNMPLMLQTLATAQGDTLIYDESDPGGYTFQLHSTNATTISKIFLQPWDIVVLQEQSQLPAFDPAQVATDVYPFAHKLDSMIRANDTCTQTMFLMTWAHANGDPSNCASYPPICTYAGYQARLRESYLQMRQDNKAVVAPVGVAWKAIMDSFSSIWLYTGDSSHPVVPGSYLEACVLYSSIFHKKTIGSTYTPGLTSVVANTLQRVSDRVVFDSLVQWQQYGHYPYAGASHTVSGSTVTFAQHSPVPAADYWAFGDGGTDTASNPVHTYTGAGPYVVVHTVSTDCFTETLTDTLHLGTTGIAFVSGQALQPVSYTQDGHGSVTFILPAGHNYSKLDVYDVNGKLTREYDLTGGNVSGHFAPGIYIYRAYSADRGMFVNGKLIVY